jgi:hypothetical protein
MDGSKAKDTVIGLSLHKANRPFTKARLNTLALNVIKLLETEKLGELKIYAIIAQ